MDTEIITSIMSEFNRVRPSNSQLPILMGEKYLAENDSYPRVVWVPATDSFSAAEPMSQNPRAIGTDIAYYDVHCWGNTIDDTRQLMHSVIRAARATLSGYSLGIEGAEWNREGEFSAFGHLVTLKLAFRIPVTEMSDTTVEIGSDSGEVIIDASVYEENINESTEVTVP